MALRLNHTRHDLVPLPQHVLQSDVLQPCVITMFWSRVRKFLNTTRCGRPVFALMLYAGRLERIVFRNFLNATRCQRSAFNSHTGNTSYAPVAASNAMDQDGAGYLPGSPHGDGGDIFRYGMTVQHVLQSNEWCYLRDVPHCWEHRGQR